MTLLRQLRVRARLSRRESYRNDHSKMVVQLQQPCRVRYRRRAVERAPRTAGVAAVAAEPTAAAPFRIRVDRDLCQGHAVCVSEAAEVFDIERDAAGGDKVALLEESPPPELRERVERAVRHCPTRALSIEE